VLAPVDGCKTPKEQQPSFLLGQFQIELRKTFPQSALEVLRVSSELEASHKIIRETHQVCLALALCFEFLFKPQIKREVQVHVTQHKRYWAALWRTLLGRDECPIDHRPTVAKLPRSAGGPPRFHRCAASRGAVSSDPFLCRIIRAAAVCVCR